ncbi:hypothetical protein HZC07_04720 [Candidatus Micrarchaeota archaeon]|nr:hypothetical protein [Candidatus Micrarchaeota archaeon]
MCKLCELSKTIPEYSSLLSKMLEEDRLRIEGSKKSVSSLPSIRTSIYSSMKWPVKLVFPMFEARAAYSVPNNYFQNLSLDDSRVGNFFSHGSMRSLFFSGEKLVLFSKSTNFRDGYEFFTSFLLVDFSLGDYRCYDQLGDIHIVADSEKPLLNLVTGKIEKKKISFHFIGQSVGGHIVSKEQVANSDRFKSVYEKYGGAQLKSSSIDLEGYALTVPHFSPHPYLLTLHKKFGYSNAREFQENSYDYFRSHLSIKV